MSRVIKHGTGIRLPPMPSIRDILHIFRLQARKSLSQNFLVDERLSARIVRHAGDITNQHVLEVGPGAGCITRSIIRQEPKQLVVVEKDRRFVPTIEKLREACSPFMTLDIYRDDILRFPIEKAFPKCPIRKWEDPVGPLHLIGNLPFAISTRLLINWFKDISLRRGAWSFGRSPMVLTFQKEVADRIVAPMMDEERCRLSVMSQIWTKPMYRYTIKGACFVPPPKVDVGVVRFEPLAEPLTTLPFDLVEKVMRYIFSMRQKPVHRCISNLYPPEVREDYTNMTVAEAQIDPEARCYQLSTYECLRVAAAYHEMLNKYPEVSTYNYQARKVKGSSKKKSNEEFDLDVFYPASIEDYTADEKC